MLEGFVKVYQAYYEAGAYAAARWKQPKKNGATDEEADEAAKAAAKAAGEQVAKDHISAGNPLGTFSFTAQTQ